MKPGEPAFDAWSLAHVASGLAIAYSTDWDDFETMTALIAYEFFEAILRNTPGHDGQGLFEYESWPNILGDVAAGYAGYLAGKKMR